MTPRHQLTFSVVFSGWNTWSFGLSQITDLDDQEHSTVDHKKLFESFHCMFRIVDLLHCPQIGGLCIKWLWFIHYSPKMNVKLKLNLRLKAWIKAESTLKWNNGFEVKVLEYRVNTTNMWLHCKHGNWLSAGLLQALFKPQKVGKISECKLYQYDHHLHIPGVPLHIQSLAVDLQVILFTFLRGSNSLKFTLEAAEVAMLSGSSATEW